MLFLRGAGRRHPPRGDGREVARRARSERSGVKIFISKPGGGRSRGCVKLVKFFEDPFISSKPNEPYTKAKKSDSWDPMGCLLIMKVGHKPSMVIKCIESRVKG